MAACACRASCGIGRTPPGGSWAPWGRGVALGLGLAMATAALVEIWELVDRLLTRFFEHEDR